MQSQYPPVIHTSNIAAGIGLKHREGVQSGLVSKVTADVVTYFTHVLFIDLEELDSSIPCRLRFICKSQKREVQAGVVVHVFDDEPNCLRKVAQGR